MSQLGCFNIFCIWFIPLLIPKWIWGGLVWFLKFPILTRRRINPCCSVSQSCYSINISFLMDHSHQHTSQLPSWKKKKKSPLPPHFLLHNRTSKMFAYTCGCPTGVTCTWKLSKESCAHSKGNHEQNRTTTYRVGKNICKQCGWQGINFQNIQTAHIAQYETNKQPSKKSKQI